MTTDLSSLIERIEKSEGADREIDLAIAVALDRRPEWLAKSEGELWIDRSGTYPVLRWADVCIGQSRGNPDVDDPAKFTASLDAAMTLVPDGWSFEVRSSGTGDPGQASVWNPMRAPGHEEYRVSSFATPALALCAASLKARSQSHEG